MTSLPGEQWQFVMDYLQEHFEVDATDEEFHEEFHRRFGGARRETRWGAQPVGKAQRLLKRMYDSGVLDRGRVTLGCNWQPGFPLWVYGYTLKRRHHHDHANP